MKQEAYITTLKVGMDDALAHIASLIANRTQFAVTYDGIQVVLASPAPRNITTSTAPPNPGAA